ncbi:hypothetical protein MTR_4g085560 [Medicago truncatula]|uniref:Uncharacterized protein n=1 Tax=Medicago truncatula TaxID=3880 RepID=G7JK11_MEDTR|nr:hypothetical protein MTR_4g085560 [Medicago truncatula]
MDSTQYTWHETITGLFFVERMRQALLSSYGSVLSKIRETNPFKLTLEIIESEILRRNILPGSKPIPLDQPKWYS